MALSRPSWRVEAAQANERQTCQTFLAPASPIFALAKLEDPEAAQANGVRHSRQKLVNWSPATYPRVSTVPVEFRDLRWAIVASKHRSLRQAAEALRIKQPTLSRGLRNLEYRLGVTLFKRTNGGTRPTVEGQEFLEAARRFVDETEAITVRGKNRSRGESGRLTIGIHTSLSAGNLRATLIEHRHRFPDVDRQLVDGASDHLISDLASSAIDVAFVAGLSPRWSDRSLLLWSERVVAALPANHPLTGRDVVHWGELRHESLLMSQRGPGPEFLKLLDSKLGSSDPCPLVRHDVVLDRLLSLVGVDWGILLVLESATGAVYPGVTFREVHDAEGPTRLSLRAYWRQDNANPSLRPLLDLLRERYPDISAAPDAS
ncbi:DNA-binding transcriptional LysR family regulator [Bradyrhizobium elkanii]|uniref:LysR substrate-binding domain-containing protein n=1 Tax=Bradyrhizobium TaxID=374 RepID=UPI002169703A|nr:MULTISPECIES: LysR family transcriptional regulator [Bradyrhizobium]MCS3926198.1 DNA-binding transcriptional LysR family regulator [Bradyrhizobium elkanii]MCS3966750.1 DNA-binding transcriptional LysR family regulator [Bradyrhizobium japonicum]